MDDPTSSRSSYGGFLALELTLRHPERVGRLILAGTAPALDYPEVIMANANARGTPRQVAVVEDAFTRGARDDTELEEMMRTILPLYFETSGERLYDEVLGDVTYSAAAMNHAFSRCIPLYDVRSELHRIAVPTLLLVGRHDWICPVREGSERLMAGLPRAELVVFERSGHFPFVEGTETFLAALRGWEARTL